MEKEERIKQLKAELEALEGEAKRANNIGAVALQKIKDSIIDYILCTDNCTVDAYRVLTKGVDGRFVSDHFPLYADLRIPKQNGRTFC